MYSKYKKYIYIYTTYKSQYSLYIAFHSAIACLIEATLVIPGLSFWIRVDTTLIYFLICFSFLSSMIAIFILSLLLYSGFSIWMATEVHFKKLRALIVVIFSLSLFCVNTEDLLRVSAFKLR